MSLEEENRRLREALEVFAAPRASQRIPDHSQPAEQDVLKIEVTVGDWLRACVFTGRMDEEYLRALPNHIRPSDAFIDLLSSQQHNPHDKPQEERSENQ